MKPSEASRKLAQLREQGWKVRVLHQRQYDKHGNLQPRGGTTLVKINGNVAVAVCSDQDNYCKKTGLAIALGRVLKRNELAHDDVL